MMKTPNLTKSKGYLKLTNIYKSSFLIVVIVINKALLSVIRMLKYINHDSRILRGIIWIAERAVCSIPISCQLELNI